MNTQTDRDYFSKQADAYITYRPTYPPAYVSFLCDYAQKKNLAWDAGCGSGQITRLLADQFNQVYASDMSQSQLGKAPSLPNIRYVCEPAEVSTLGAQSVNFIIAAQAAHWFDMEAFALEVRRVATHDAIIACIGYGKVESEHPVIEAINEFYFHVIHRYWPPGRELLETHYRDLVFPFEELALPEQDYFITKTFSKETLIGYLMSWSAVVRFENTTGQNAHAIIDEMLESKWNEEMITFRWPLFARLGYALR